MTRAIDHLNRDSTAKRNCSCKALCAATAALLLASTACAPNPDPTVQQRSQALGFVRGVRNWPSIDKDRELMIRDLSVVEDSGRTIEPCDGFGSGSGDLPVWSFGWLMSQVAEQAKASDPAEFVLNWLKTWDSDQPVNGFTVPRRELMRPIITDPWLQASGGFRLDLTKAPFRLAAIVNRMDLRRSEGEQVLDAGEARFVFNAVDSQ